MSASLVFPDVFSGTLCNDNFRLTLKLTEWSVATCTSIIIVQTRRVPSNFINSGYLYSAPSRNLLRGALSPTTYTAKEKCLKKLAERRDVVDQFDQSRRLAKEVQCTCRSNSQPYEG